MRKYLVYIIPKHRDKLPAFKNDFTVFYLANRLIFLFFHPSPFSRSRNELGITTGPSCSFFRHANNLFITSALRIFFFTFDRDNKKSIILYVSCDLRKLLVECTKIHAAQNSISFHNRWYKCKIVLSFRSRIHNYAVWLVHFWKNIYSATKFIFVSFFSIRGRAISLIHTHTHTGRIWIQIDAFYYFIPSSVIHCSHNSTSALKLSPTDRSEFLYTYPL